MLNMFENGNDNDNDIDQNRNKTRIDDALDDVFLVVGEGCGSKGPQPYLLLYYAMHSLQKHPFPLLDLTWCPRNQRGKGPFLSCSPLRWKLHESGPFSFAFTPCFHVIISEFLNPGFYLGKLHGLDHIHLLSSLAFM